MSTAALWHMPLVEKHERAALLILTERCNDSWSHVTRTGWLIHQHHAVSAEIDHTHIQTKSSWSIYRLSASIPRVHNWCFHTGTGHVHTLLIKWSSNQCRTWQYMGNKHTAFHTYRRDSIIFQRFKEVFLSFHYMHKTYRVTKIAVALSPVFGTCNKIWIKIIAYIK